jgi:hypothetical protein
MQEIRDPRGEEPGRRAPRQPVRTPDEGSELADLFAAYTAEVDRRIQKGLEAIHRSSIKVMRQLVAEVWRAGGPEAASNLREGVLGSIARDDAIRGLLSHTDERYQALSVRLDRMQGAVRQLAEATREAVRRSNLRAAEAAEATRATRERVEAIDRLGRSLAPLPRRVEALTVTLEQQQRRHREDLVRFGDRTVRALTEVQRRLHRLLRSETERVREAVQGELQRLEAAVRSETAFGAETAAGLRGSIAELAERTGNVLAALETRLTGQHHDVNRLAERTTRVVAETSERLLAGTRAILTRLEALETRSGSMEEAFRVHRRHLAEFTERAGRGLDELSRRIGEGFRLTLERSRAERRQALDQLEASLHREIGTIRTEIESVAARTGQVLEGLRADLAQRVDRAGRTSREETLNLVTGLVTRQGGQQVKSLEAIRRSLHALLDSVRRSGQQQAAAVERVLRASAGRQEALLDEVLSALRASMEELNGAAAAPPEEDDPRSGEVLTRKLRGVEQRLAELSRELVGEPSRG